MHLKKAYDKRTGRTYLSIVHEYRDTEGKSRARTVQSIGYLDELLKTYEDPISQLLNVQARDATPLRVFRRSVAVLRRICLKRDTKQALKLIKIKSTE